MRPVSRTVGTLLALMLAMSFLPAAQAGPVADKARPDAAAPAAPPVFVRFQTERGDVLMVMYPELAPHHVANFAHLSRSGFFAGTRFHRIVPGFVIQGGDPFTKDDDPTNDGTGVPTIRDVLGAEDWLEYSKADPTQAEAMLADKGFVAAPKGKAYLKAEFSPARHLRGTLSMARSDPLDSAGSQFFLCVSEASFLDRAYTVFGHVVLGLDVVDKIVNAERTSPASETPAVPVQVIATTVLEGVGELTKAELAAWEAFPAELKNIR
jgi:peptidyl-prolyl cis-trans isomerase B (cyclophilin B)